MSNRPADAYSSGRAEGTTRCMRDEGSNPVCYSGPPPRPCADRWALTTLQGLRRAEWARHMPGPPAPSSPILPGHVSLAALCRSYPCERHAMSRSARQGRTRAGRARVRLLAGSVPRWADPLSRRMGAVPCVPDGSACASATPARRERMKLCVFVIPRGAGRASQSHAGPAGSLTVHPTRAGPGMCRTGP